MNPLRSIKTLLAGAIVALGASFARADAPMIKFGSLTDESFDQSKVVLEKDVIADPKAVKVVLIAGRKSHGQGEHEHFAGTWLLQQALMQNGINAVMARDGWPKDEKIFEGTKAIMFYCDGGAGHPLIAKDGGEQKRLALVQKYLKQGAGFACYHYGVEFPKNDGPSVLPMLGGYFEPYWSVNPHWLAGFKELPKHPITNGVKPFTIQDEWYYHMRFQPDMKGVTPILTAVPPDGTRGKEGPDQPHGGNQYVRARKGQPEHMAWAYEREDGGRAFGFTGAHFHRNWGDENFRRLVVNSLLWVAKVEVPAAGAKTELNEADLIKCLDDKRPKPKN